MTLIICCTTLAGWFFYKAVVLASDFDANYLRRLGAVETWLMGRNGGAAARPKNHDYIAPTKDWSR